mmetsp:Transcript_47483/g.119643  ORF Transcript_47483/g.119643 Transcript_47483/m.119643 type:complete len:238 (-) Transcript_47483:97-810(-)
MRVLHVAAVVGFGVEALGPEEVAVVVVVLASARVRVAAVDFAADPSEPAAVVVIWKHGYAIDRDGDSASLRHAGHARQRGGQRVRGSVCERRGAEWDLEHVELRGGGSNSAALTSARWQRDALQVELVRGGLPGVVAVGQTAGGDDQVLVVTIDRLYGGAGGIRSCGRESSGTTRVGRDCAGFASQLGLQRRDPVWDFRVERAIRFRAVSALGGRAAGEVVARRSGDRSEDGKVQVL